MSIINIFRVQAAQAFKNAFKFITFVENNARRLEDDDNYGYFDTTFAMYMNLMYGNVDFLKDDYEIIDFLQRVGLIKPHYVKGLVIGIDFENKDGFLVPHNYGERINLDTFLDVVAAKGGSLHTRVTALKDTLRDDTLISKLQDNPLFEGVSVDDIMDLAAYLLRQEGYLVGYRPRISSEMFFDHLAMKSNEFEKSKKDPHEEETSITTKAIYLGYDLYVRHLKHISKDDAGLFCEYLNEDQSQTQYVICQDVANSMMNGDEHTRDVVRHCCFHKSLGRSSSYCEVVGKINQLPYTAMAHTPSNFSLKLEDIPFDDSAAAHAVVDAVSASIIEKPRMTLGALLAEKMNAKK